MPYIKQAKRVDMDKIVRMMQLNHVQADGDLNYILFAFCKRNIVPSYNNYKNFCGELRQCATEIERKLLGPYEDLKEQENGKICSS